MSIEDLIVFFKKKGFTIKKNGRTYEIVKEVKYTDYNNIENELTIELDRNKGYNIEINDHVSTNENNVFIYIKLALKQEEKIIASENSENSIDERIGNSLIEKKNQINHVFNIIVIVVILFISIFFVNRSAAFFWKKILILYNKFFFKFYLRD